MTRALWFLNSCLLVALAYGVMPDGPWYRQIGAVLLVQVSCLSWLLHAWRS